MERILFIMGNMGLGGAETHVMKVYRKIDREMYQFDFVLNVPSKCFYEDEILSMGGRVYRVTPKSQNIKRNYKDIRGIVSEEHYKIVFKCGEQAMSWTEMFAAKRGGASKRIMRSTNSKAGKSLTKMILHKISRIPLRIFVTEKIAPSKDAGEWLFGKRGCKDLVLMNNGLDIENYMYTEEKARRVRKKFHILMDATVVGHVGRFNEQKNHGFLLEIFKKYHEENSNSYLLLVGDGPLKNEFEKKVKASGLNSFVIFAGNQSNVCDIYSAMDMFVFPSFFEGMPNTVIEAQANGLKCFVSDTITKDADLTGRIEYLKLDDAKKWVERMSQSSLERVDTKGDLIKAGYDIESVVQQYIKIFERRR